MQLHPTALNKKQPAQVVFSVGSYLKALRRACLAVSHDLFNKSRAVLAARTVRTEPEGSNFRKAIKF
jgi:hypothetical protein